MGFLQDWLNQPPRSVPWKYLTHGRVLLDSKIFSISAYSEIERISSEVLKPRVSFVVHKQVIDIDHLVNDNTMLVHAKFLLNLVSTYRYSHHIFGNVEWNAPRPLSVSQGSSS